MCTNFREKEISMCCLPYMPHQGSNLQPTGVQDHDPTNRATGPGHVTVVLIHPPAGGHLGIMSSAAKKRLYASFGETMCSFLMGKYPGVESRGHRGSVRSDLVDRPKSFSK